MTKKINILVSGCGGDIGQSIGKILLKESLVENLYGIDMTDKNAGQFIYSNFSIGLPVKDSGFLPFIENFINEHGIDVYIPISEPELRYFADHSILDKMGSAKMIHANKESLAIGFDKLKTVEFLIKNNLPFPNTFSGDKYLKMDKYPFIVKSAKGSGSKQLHIIEDVSEMEYLKKKLRLKEYIVQELLPDASEEYTCGLFRGQNNDIRSIIFRRELTGGYSGYGELVENNAITSLLEIIALRINLIGSINVQLRLSFGVPYVFEINPRFSSTVLFRSLFGFNDVLWSIQDALSIPLSEYNRPWGLKRFYKGFMEYVK